MASGEPMTRIGTATSAATRADVTLREKEAPVLYILLWLLGLPLTLILLLFLLGVGR
jgi:hypothetical protein